MAWNSHNKSSNFVNATCKISDLTPGMTGVKVIGLVISKGTPRDRITSNAASGESTPKSVFTFTIRDSLKDFINITCWASTSNGPKIAASFHIGDVVQVSNASVQQKIEGSFADRCLVQTPDSYLLSINDRNKSIELYRGDGAQRYFAMKSELIAPVEEHMNLTEVMQYANTKSKNNENQEYMTFFAGVKYVGEIRESVVRNTLENEQEGKTVKRLQVSLFDDSCACLPLIIWDEENMRLATTWISRKTILSLVHCRIKYDSYRNGFVGALESQSVVIVNPCVKEVVHLKVFMETFALTHFSPDEEKDIALAMSAPIPDDITDTVALTSIHQIATVSDLLDNNFENKYGIIYGILSRFDIDSADSLMYTIRRCRQCKRKVCMEPLSCVNENCSINLINLDNTQLDFGTVIHISDHTGTLNTAYFGGSAMEEFLKQTPQQFLMTSKKDRTRLKYRFFMNRIKIYFKTSLSSYNSNSGITKILAIHQPDFHEVMEALRYFDRKKSEIKSSD